jgi:protein gp37
MAVSSSIVEIWVLNIRDQCASVDVPFFFSQRDGLPKQWGGTNKKKAG